MQMNRAEVQSQNILQRSGRSRVLAPEAPGQLDDGESTTFPPGAGDLGSQFKSPQVSRRRPRFITAQDLDEALLQAIEGKITRKNAWVSKDASNLLDGITQTVESTLDSTNSAGDYIRFAKVATVVEGCSKVWTSRVESTYQRSNQMVRRLLRNEKEDQGSDDENKEECDDEDGVTGSFNGAAAAERRRKAAQRRGNAVSTIASLPSEIDLDRKMRLALVRTGVSAQFRAITEKFDQGSAQGLLVHNTPLGGAGNFILDEDYAREPKDGYSTGSGPQHCQSDHIGSDSEGGGTGTAQHGFADGTIKDEVDEGLETVLELPPFTAGIMQPNERDGPTLASRGSATVAGVDGGATNAGGPSGDGVRVSSTNISHELNNLNRSSLTLSSSLGEHRAVEAIADRSRNDATRAVISGQCEDQGHEFQDGGWLNDGDGADFECDLGVYGEEDDRGQWVSNKSWGGEGNVDVPPELVASEARRLVSGIAELDNIANRLDGKQLALQEEDPNGWVPMAEPESNFMFGARTRRNATIMGLRKEHRFLGPNMSQSSGAQPVKRQKCEGVVYDLFGELKVISEAAALNLACADQDKTRNGDYFYLPAIESPEGCGVNISALKQSTSDAKNICSIGKELLMEGNFEAMKCYLQTSVQKVEAQNAGLLLHRDPVVGVDIPYYLTYPITVPFFFQPFSTPLLQWNLLRKTASGSAVHDYTNATGYGYAEEDSENKGAGDMPAEIFHGGADFENDYGDMGNYDGFDDGNRDGDFDNPLRLAQAQIFANLDQTELMRSSVALTTISSNSARASGMVASVLAELDSDAARKVLHPPETVLPTQVDVVLLRKIMWAVLCGDVVFQETEQKGAKLASRWKRGRGTEAERSAETKDNDESEAAVKKVLFSEVVLQLLPQVPTVSATATLSPAFFFFSLLFLANEHGLFIESVPSMDDLIVHVPLRRGEES